MHRIVVAHWNKQIDEGAPRLFSPTELFDYMLDAYARITPIRADVDDFDRMVLAWGRRGADGSAPMGTISQRSRHRTDLTDIRERVTTSSVPHLLGKGCSYKARRPPRLAHRGGPYGHRKPDKLAIAVFEGVDPP